MYWDTRWQLAGAGKELCPNAFSSQRTVSCSQVMIQCSLVLEARVFTTDTLRIFSESIQCIQNDHFCGAIKCCTMRDTSHEF